MQKIEGAVATIAVVGKFHSGKSFLLNQLMGKRQGFGVGPYVRPKTMGIWMWGKVGHHYDPTSSLVLMLQVRYNAKPPPLLVKCDASLNL